MVVVDNTEFVLADVPGLVEGAHRGRGLGHRFLGHVERCGVLIHLIDGLQEDLFGAYKLVRDELLSYSPVLGEKFEIVVLNKCDAMGSDLVAEKRDDLSSATSSPVHVISAVTGFGVTDLLRHVYTRIHAAQSLTKPSVRTPWEP